MSFKKRPQLPGAVRTRAWHHHGSHTPTSPGAILLVKFAVTPRKKYVYKVQCHYFKVD